MGEVESLLLPIILLLRLSTVHPLSIEEGVKSCNEDKLALRDIT